MPVALAIFRPSTVVIRKQNGNYDSFRASQDTDISRGAALLDAVAASEEGDEILIGPGVFDIASETITVPHNCAFIGAGRAVTEIQSQTLSTDNGCIIKGGNNSRISHFTITANGDPSLYQFCIGSSNDNSATDQISTDVYVEDVVMTSDSDGVVLSQSSSPTMVWTFVNCQIVTKFDGIVIHWNGVNATFIDCEVTAIGPSAVAGASRAAALVMSSTTGGSFVSMKGCSLSASGNASANYGAVYFDLTAALVFDFYQTDFTTSGTGVNDIRIPSGSGSTVRCRVSDCRYDISKVFAGAGNIRFQDVSGGRGAPILDPSSNELLRFTATASAVNEVTLVNAATTTAPQIQATGGDTNISLNLVPKGTGVVQSNGVEVVTTTGTQTLTNKTLTNPVMTTPTLGVASATRLTLTGTNGGGYLELVQQTPSNPSLPGGNDIRICRGPVGHLSILDSSFTKTLVFPTNDLTFTFPSGTSTLATLALSETLSNKTLASPTVTGAIILPDGVRQTFNPDATNAGINVGSVAGDPSSPSNGDLWYDSTANELTARINGANVALGSGGSSVFPNNYISGFTLSNNGSDATNDIDIASGQAAEDTNASMLTTAATNVKQLDVEFAEYVSIGTASGGRAAADNLTGAKWFHAWVIGGSGKNTQGFFSTSLSPTLPTGFTTKRRIGSVYWTGSTLKAFTQDGDWFNWVSLSQDFNSDITTSRTTITLLVPTGVRVRATILGSQSGADTAATRFDQIDETDAAVSATFNDAAGSDMSTAGSVAGRCTKTLLTNTSGQIGARASAAATSISVYTRSWIDTRGKL